MNILYNLTKDVKEAKNLLKTNSEDLSKGDNLFRKRFYKALSKASKIRKKSREISRQLGSSERKRNKQGQSKTKRPQGYSRPFQPGAPSRSARGGACFSFKPRGSASKSNRGKPTFSFSKPRSNKKSIIPCQPGYSGKQGCISVSKSGAKHKFASRSSKKTALGTSRDGLSGRRKASAFFGQLEVANTGFPHFFQFQIQGLFQVKQVIFKVSSMQNSRTFPG